MLVINRNGGPITSALSVSFIVYGTATFGDDYRVAGPDAFSAGSGTITFPPGSTTTTITVDPIADYVNEPDEWVVLTLAPGSGYTLGTLGPVGGIIANDDVTVYLAVSSSSVFEDGATNLVFTFTRSGGPISSALVVYFKVEGDASVDTDYVQYGAATFNSSFGSVIFDAWAWTKAITIDPTADNLVENDESVVLTLVGGRYEIGTVDPVSAKIANDDASVTLAISTPSVWEDGLATLDYVFTRSQAPTTWALPVSFTVGGDAAFYSDYRQNGASSFSATAGTVIFQPGADKVTLRIYPIADNVVEGDESITLLLMGGTRYDTMAASPVTGTILNDDVSVALTVSPSAVPEDSHGNFIFTFVRSRGPISSSLTVGFNVGGSATLYSDYTQNGAAYYTCTGAVVFPAGATNATIEIDPTADNVVEQDETVVLSLRPGSGYGIETTGAVTGTIANDDVRVTLDVSPSSVPEDGPANLVFTFVRSGGPIASALNVNFNVGGSALLSDSDYTVQGAASFSANAGMVTFAPGAATATIIIDPTADNIAECDESVVIGMVGGSGYTVGSGCVSGTITNDDVRITLAISTPSVLEDGAANLVYTFIRAGGPISAALTVNFIWNGTATLGIDYTVTGATTFSSNMGTVVIPPYATTKALVIDPTPDNLVEDHETVIIRLVGGQGYNLVTLGDVTGTITNDDAYVSLSVSPSTVWEDGAPNLVYTFVRSAGPSSWALSVNFKVDGTATVGSDYALLGASISNSNVGTVTFPAGVNSVAVTVDPKVDNMVEPDELVVFTLVGGVRYEARTTAGVTGIIANDDSTVTLTVSSSSVFEDGAPNLIFTFTRSGGPVTSALTVSFTVSGNATLNTDYTVLSGGAASFTATSGTVIIPAGAYAKNLTIDPTADLISETDETVILTLVDSAGYTAGTTTPVTGILLNDDDVSVTLAVSPSSVLEDGPVNMTYTFTRSGGPTTLALTVNFAYGGTAIYTTDSTTDYTQKGAATFSANAGTVVFTAGASTATVMISPTPDNAVELDETVTILLTAGSGYTIGTPGAVVGTIANDDVKVALAVSPSSVLEDGPANLTFTFTRSGGPYSSALKVNFGYDGTATLNTDYIQVSSEAE